MVVVCGEDVNLAVTAVYTGIDEVTILCPEKCGTTWFPHGIPIGAECCQLAPTPGAVAMLLVAMTGVQVGTAVPEVGERKRKGPGSPKRA